MACVLTLSVSMALVLSMPLKSGCVGSTGDRLLRWRQLQLPRYSTVFLGRLRQICLTCYNPCLQVETRESVCNSLSCMACAIAQLLAPSRFNSVLQICLLINYRLNIGIRNCFRVD
ncbi:hypothetical protein JB92DRAFT_773237 [Gautieria morchelliformis]|nr:hypothetical protein JB92DRAFT_773237 [Gautieria morchelliformis]